MTECGKTEFEVREALRHLRACCNLPSDNEFKKSCMAKADEILADRPTQETQRGGGDVIEDARVVKGWLDNCPSTDLAYWYAEHKPRIERMCTSLSKPVARTVTADEFYAGFNGFATWSDYIQQTYPNGLIISPEEN